MAATTPEGKLTEAVKRFLNKTPGIYFLKYHGTSFGRVGVPDILVCAWGKFVALELKAPGEKATPRQLEEHRIMRRSGATVGVFDNLNDVKAFIENLEDAVDVALCSVGPCYGLASSYCLSCGAPKCKRHLYASMVCKDCCEGQ